MYCDSRVMVSYELHMSSSFPSVWPDAVRCALPFRLRGLTFTFVSASREEISRWSVRLGGSGEQDDTVDENSKKLHKAGKHVSFNQHDGDLHRDAEDYDCSAESQRDGTLTEIWVCSCMLGSGHRMPS